MLRREAHVAGNLFHSQLNTKTHKDSVSTDIAVAADINTKQGDKTKQEFSIFDNEDEGNIQMLIDKGSVSAVS
jgi:hypothetical protein